MKNYRLKYYIKIYFKILTQDIKSKMQFRVDFFISSLGILAQNTLGLITFWILFHSIPNIQSWNYNEMMFFYSFSLLAITPAQMFFENLWEIGTHVYSGDFIRYCFRPINIFFYYVSEVFDFKGLTQFLFGAFTLTYAWSNLHIPVSLFNIPLLILNLFGASFAMIGIMVLASSSAFWIMNSSSVMTFSIRFRDYAKYPITIFNKFFQFIFSFIIPIGFIAFYPSQIFLRPNDFSIISLLTPVIGFLFFLFSYNFWMMGARKYSGTGS